jgi:hypothetical protein
MARERRFRLRSLGWGVYLLRLPTVENFEVKKTAFLLALVLVVAACGDDDESGTATTAAGTAAATPVAQQPIAFAAGSADFTITSADTYVVAIEQVADFAVVAVVDDGVTQTLPIPTEPLFAVAADGLAVTITSGTESVQGNLSGLSYDPSTGSLSGSMTVTSVLSGAGVQPGPSSSLTGPIVLHVPLGSDLWDAMAEAGGDDDATRSSIWRSTIDTDCTDWMGRTFAPKCNGW